MVLAIQAGWIEQLNQDQTRAQKWIEMAEGVRLYLVLAGSLILRNSLNIVIN
jgi:hypothetical protein